MSEALQLPGGGGSEAGLLSAHATSGGNICCASGSGLHGWRRKRKHHHDGVRRRMGDPPEMSPPGTSCPIQAAGPAHTPFSLQTGLVPGTIPTRSRVSAHRRMPLLVRPCATATQENGSLVLLKAYTEPVSNEPTQFR